MKNSFILYHEYREHLELLSDAERGQLLMAICDYSEKGVVPELSGMCKMAFSFIKKQIDRDAEKYEETCRKNTEAAKKRWDKSNTDQCEGIPPHTVAYQAMPSDAKNADNDNDNDNDLKKDIPNGISKEKISPKKNVVNFKPPTVAEIKTYCLERKNSVNAEQFFDYYAARGWMLSKTKMKDWRASVRTWERNNNVEGVKLNEKCKPTDQRNGGNKDVW